MNKVVNDMQGSLIRGAYEGAKASSVDLGLGQINLKPSKTTVDAVIASAQDMGSYKYTATQGDPELRELIAQRHNAKNGTEYTKDNVLVTAGASAAISSTYLALLDEKTNIVVPEIAYPTYEMVPQMFGEGKYDIRSLKLDGDFIPDLGNLEKKIDENSILVLNSPNNPTGVVIPSKTLFDMSMTIRKAGAMVISDEVYSEVYVKEAPGSISTYLPEKTVVVDSLSKCGLIPGMRIGWAIAPDNIIGNIVKVHQNMNSCVNSIAQYAAISVLNNTEQFEDLRDKMGANRDRLKGFLDGKGLVSTVGGIYCFVNSSHLGNSIEASRKILDGADVVTIPGMAFGEKGDDFVRLSYGVDSDTLEEGINRLDEFL